MSGHTRSMGAAAKLGRRDVHEPSEAEPRAPTSAPSLEAIYEAQFDFVWRSARRMGVAEASVDDVVQEVFLVAHRRLGDFEGRSSVKTWLFGILLRVVSDYRRTQRRKGGLAPLPDTLACDPADSPVGRTEQREAVQTLHRLLDALDEDKRAVFVLAELEQMTVPEIADALGANLNTVYSRLRAARKDFEKALERHRAREAGR